MTNISRSERVKHEAQILRNHQAQMIRGVQAVPLLKSYGVFKTNSDLECLEAVHVGINRDVAESYMFQAFVAGQHREDFYIESGQDIVAYMFSDRTKQLRGECQG